ncbi:MAG TPA: MFS transporter [Acidimicrobiales bacterium]|nr:MFS transporter [Acidimicrobiales bacterium]
MMRLRDRFGGVSGYPLMILAGLAFMDAADQAAYGILLPDIRDALNLTDTGILLVSAIGGGMGLLGTVPIAWLADRTSRVRLALIGAAVWALFSMSTGLATVVVLLVIVRCGTSIGQAVVFPTHNSLIADYYPIEVRPKVYASHQLGNVLGQLFGVLAGAGLATAFGWRVPFIVFGIPVVLLVVLGLKMREPVRGSFERAAAGIGAEAEAMAIAEVPPSYAEAYRMVWKIGTLRRVFAALPFLAASIIGFTSIAALQYDRTFGLTTWQRGWVSVPVLAVQVGGLLIGARVATVQASKSVARMFTMIGWAAGAGALFALGFAAAPNAALAVAANAALVACLAIVGPGVLAALSLAIPARARAIGFSIGALFILPGLVVLPLVGWVGDTWGLRWGMAVMTPVLVIGGLIISSARSVVDDDIADVWTGSATRAELLAARARGDMQLLMIRQLDVRYGDVRVLFDVDAEIAEGEIVALLGTNGAGKSTLLGAISGTVEASNGAVVFDGRDITHAPPEEIARLGITQMPGGKGVFPTLTVAENLRAAAWMSRGDAEETDRRVAEVHELFDVLAQRTEEPAANLSGGQQQMLALGMALIVQPRLLLIDELSLGLAPLVVDELLGVVEMLRDRGTTIILVEQSVNVALAVADRAYFMEKGAIRYSGPTAELLERPDLVRSVYLASAGANLATPAARQADRPQGTASDGPSLEVAHLRVAFGGIAAVDDVSLAFTPGEIVGVIGPNGAGKTTLFDAISGFVSTDAGEVIFDGHDITRWSPDRRARIGLGRSFQDSRLFESLSVTETLSVALDRWVQGSGVVNAVFRLPAHQLTEAAVAARVDELIDAFGLESFRHKLLRELSTGSRRVVDLACVVAHGPSVVLLDEPSSGIAQREAEALAPLLNNLRDRLDATLLVVEHDLALISRVADRMVAMDQGRIVTVGSPAEVLEHPEVIASYLGTGTTARERSGPLATSSSDQGAP